MSFVVKLGVEVIGVSELESGDPPMGAAGGRLKPTPAYSSIRRYCIAHRDRWVDIPGLAVETAGGVPIVCCGPIQIIDFSSDLGGDGIEIHLNGIVSPSYDELFPYHVNAYRKQFSVDRR